MKSIEEIRQVKNRVEGNLLKMANVTGVDIGNKYIHGGKTDTLAIRVYVSKKMKVPEKDLIPKEIEGIPTDVIERKFVLHRVSGS
jgi:hypothetical protein